MDTQSYHTHTSRFRRRSALSYLAGLLLAALALTACSGVFDQEEEQASLGALAPPTPGPTMPAGTATGTRILSRGALVAGVRFDLQPFGYVTVEGEVAGFDVDLAREMARRWLGDAEAVDFRQVRSDTAVEHLVMGDVDVAIAALTHTQEREALVDFGQTYFVDGQALLVRAADAQALTGPASLFGHPVGILAWQGADDALWAAVTFTPTIQYYDRFDESVDGLRWGEVNALADLRRRLFWGKYLFPETAIVGQYTTEPVAFAYSQDDAFFADLVNLTFQEMVADGTYAELYTRWFHKAPPAVEGWPGAEVPNLADGPATVSAPDTIAAIQTRTRLAVAVAPGSTRFAHIDETGTATGYEVNLVRLMAERWLGDAGAVDFIPASAEAGRDMLYAGQVHLMIGGLAHTRSAEMELDFSPTTYEGGLGLLARAGTVIGDLPALNGQQVAVVQGGSEGETLLTLAQDAGITAPIVARPTMEETVALLLQEQVIAVAGDRAALLEQAAAAQDLVVLPLRLTRVPLALALVPGDSAFRDLVALTLQTMKAEGQFDALYGVWFDDEPPAVENWPGTPYRSLRIEGIAANQ